MRKIHIVIAQVTKPGVHPKLHRFWPFLRVAGPSGRDKNKIIKAVPRRQSENL
jgi:hypothetical protein